MAEKTDTVQEVVDDVGDDENEVFNRNHYFGGCPYCGDTSGYLNVGRGHIFVCDEHKTAWPIGSNLFSSWREENEEIWEKNRNMLDREYKFVEPLPYEPIDEEIDGEEYEEIYDESDD